MIWQILQNWFSITFLWRSVSLSIFGVTLLGELASSPGSIIITIKLVMKYNKNIKVNNWNVKIELRV